MTLSTMLQAAPGTSPAAGRTLRSGDDFADAGVVDGRLVPEIDAVARRYAVSITGYLADRIDPADPDDPIALQFVPSAAELSRDALEIDDPIGDDSFSPVSGIVHRHPDRVLLKPILACPIYCRFCFRRESVGPHSGVLSREALDAALAYIGADPEIWEVILTGGDPLMLSDRRLGEILDRLEAIGHVGIIRIHTRVPVADPSRVTPALATLLDREKPVYVIIHCNHARELGAETVAACRTLNRRGIPLLSQTVLLKGVNDDVATMEALMRALVRQRIKPYYLHHLDRAPGTAHFRTGIAEGQALIGELRRRASGLCQPEYVLDIPGGHGKVPVGPAYLGAGGPDTVADTEGNLHPYPGANCAPLRACDPSDFRQHDDEVLE